MAFRVPPFVWETVSSPGSGAITTAGTLPSGQTGARAFASGGVGASDGVGNLLVGDTFPYSLRGQTTGATEMGIGTVTAISGSTLSFTRATVYPASGAVNFTETCDLLVAELPGVGALSTQGPWYTDSYLGVGNALLISTGGSASFGLPNNNQTIMFPFKWTGLFPIKRASIWVATAGTPVSPATTCAIRVGIYAYEAGGNATLLFEPTATTPFDGSSVGAKSLVAPTDFSPYYLPPGMYFAGFMSADATTSLPALAATNNINFTGDLDGFFGMSGSDSPYGYAICAPYNNTNQAQALLSPLTQSDISNVHAPYQQFMKLWLGAE